jgi:multidrug efflux pump subunit AcrB
MAADKPAGIDIAIFYDQAAEVAHSVNGFITNFLMALAIVVGVLLVFMGVRSGIIIALSLALNVLGTLLIMYIWGIELQRISLGALIIALSMLVDNAIVIVEGVLIARQQGSPLLGAINYVLRRSALPLLGATIIAILAFAPIGLSQDSTGEYCKSLFQVLLISLCLFRIVWIQFALPLFAGIEGVLLVYPVSWAVGAVLMVLYAWKGKWMQLPEAIS